MRELRGAARPSRRAPLALPRSGVARNIGMNCNPTQITLGVIWKSENVTFPTIIQWDVCENAFFWNCANLLTQSAAQWQKTSYRNYIGLILLPVNIILIYSIEPTKMIIYIVLGLLLVVLLSGFFTTYKSYQKLILGNLFYFILYLCALEIGPYIILFKVFN